MEKAVEGYPDERSASKKILYHASSLPKELPSSRRCRRPQRRTAATSWGERAEAISDSKAETKVELVGESVDMGLLGAKD